MIADAVAVAEHLPIERLLRVGRHRRVIGEQRRGQRRRMRRDARAEIEGDAVEMIARARRTVRAALLEAVEMRIAEIPAARALREIAADRRQMPDLRRRKPAGCAASPG